MILNSSIIIFYSFHNISITYFGCASVLQSMVTSVPDGAPTSWFGTHIIGETFFVFY